MHASSSGQRPAFRRPKTSRLRGLAAAGAVAIAATAAPAGAGFSEDFAGLLYQGRTAAAADLAAGAGETGQAGFARGAAQFLLAVETLGQGLYRYGLRSEYDGALLTGGVGDLPFLRLPVPLNPAPEPVSYAALRQVLQRFADDLATARETLAGVGPDAFDLPVDLDRIRLDFDGDGRGGEAETLMAAVRAIAGPMRAQGAYVVDFDQSDAPWLQGYCHLLSAMAEFPLAHDWEPAYHATFQNLFPAADLPSSALTLERQFVRIVERMQALENPDGSPLRYGAGDGDYETWKDSDEGRRTAEYNRLYQSLQSGGWNETLGMETGLMGSIADLVGFVHLFNWPVTDSARMARVREHLLEMIALSRENWARIEAETDDAREWIPGPDQTGVFPSVRVDGQIVEGWKLFLDEFEAILNGDRLVPHWRIMNGGINVRRMFEDPRTFDPVMILHGSAVVPYLEDGELISGDTAMTIMALLDGGLLGYFLWFN